MTQNPCRITPRFQLRLSVAIIVEVSLLLFLSLVGTRVGAQVTTVITHTTGAGDLGTQVLPPNNNVYGITGGKPVGDNLFHSFAQLDVGPGDIAQFQTTTLIPNAAMRNILGRITDTNPSIIFGTVDSAIYYPGASLFLINPYGFLFGPNAMLNVGGMVAFTTADYLKLADNVRFEAIPGAQDALLSAFPVAAFGFLGSNPEAIAVQGSTLTLAAGTGLSLVGGDITIGADPPETGTPATLMAPSGEISLASVASPGEMLLPNLQTGPNINGQSFTTMGNVSLIEGAFLDASGSPTEGTGAGGTIRIRAGQFVMDNAVLYSATQGELDGAPAAVDINVTGDVSLNNFSAVASPGFGAGRSGDINIRANNVLVENVSFVSTATDGDGQAGNIRITATDTLSVRGTDGEGNFSSIESVTNGLNRSVRAGDSGDITINAAAVSVNEGGYIRTRTESDGTALNITLETANVHLAGGGFIEIRSAGGGSTGAITVTATETVTLVGAPGLSQSAQSQINNRQNGTGSTGGISVTATEFLMTDGARIFNHSGSAAGGVNVTAHETIALSGGSEISSLTVGEEVGPIALSAPTITLTDQAVLRATTTGSGNAGAISLTGETISLSNQSFLTSRTLSSGQGGQITLDATNTVLLSGGAIITTSSLNPATGSAGPINITASNAVSLSGAGTMVLSETAGSGDGGAITIQTNQAQITDGAVISATSTGSGAAGSVTIEGNSPAQSVLIDGSGSGVFTDTQGSGAGGNIFVNADSVTLQNGGTLSASSSGIGNAGNISILADQVSLTNLSKVNTSTSGEGAGGTIHMSAEDTINAVDSFISASSNSTGLSAGSGGQVILNAPTIDVAGGDISTLTVGAGNAGDIQIQAATFRLGASENAFGLVEATTSGSGHGGNISVLGIEGSGSRANDVILSDSSSLRSESIRDGAGAAGNITIDTVRLALREGSEITTASHLNSPGNAGNVILDANESVLVSGSFVTSNVFEASTGNGGQVTIKTPNLIVNQGSDGTVGQISTSTGSSGNAGFVTINADSVTLANGGRLTSSSFLDDPIYPPATGAAGNVVVQGLNGAGTRASSITISEQDGSGAASGIFTNTDGSGPGGSMTLFANSVTLQKGGTLSAATSGTEATATGGTITVDATNTVTMNSALITAKSAGVADAGSIDITATNGLTMQNSSITTVAGQGAGGGDIKVTTSPEATVWLENSLISALVADGPGGGGNIWIDPQYVILQNSQILARAAQGQGGTITITANLFLQDAVSIVNADSGSGLHGTVTIQSPNAPASGKIQPLGKSPLLATSLLNQHCAALAGGEFSSFTVAGRDSLPTEPGSWLASPLHAAGVGKGQRVRGEGLGTGEGLGVRGEGQEGNAPFLSLRQIAPAGFLTQAFAVDWSAVCQS